MRNLKRYVPLRRYTELRSRRKGPRRRGAPKLDIRYRNWIKTLPCVICDNFGCDPAHTKVLGSGNMVWKSPDRSCIPLCRTHHREFDHGRERRSFESRHSLNIAEVVRDLNAIYHQLGGSSHAA